MCFLDMLGENRQYLSKEELEIYNRTPLPHIFLLIYIMFKFIIYSTICSFLPMT